MTRTCRSPVDCRLLSGFKIHNKNCRRTFRLLLHDNRNQYYHLIPLLTFMAETNMFVFVSDKLSKVIYYFRLSPFVLDFKIQCYINDLNHEADSPHDCRSLNESRNTFSRWCMLLNSLLGVHRPWRESLEF